MTSSPKSPKITIMQSLLTILKQDCLNSIKQALPEVELTLDQILVKPSQQAKFGHYQCNNAMGLAKQCQQNPRAIAEKIVDCLSLPYIKKIEIAGPGFINIWLKSSHLASDLNTMLNEADLAIDKHHPPQTVVVDFSSPNIAKEMHVGHLRSTIIGDCIANTLSFLGDNVLRINHVGDWGTAFGMLIHYLKQEQPEVINGEQPASLSELVQWYKNAKKLFDDNPVFKKQSQLEVVALQRGDDEALKIWQLICTISRNAFQKIYDLLNIDLAEKGESSYNEQLPDIIQALEKKGLITVSDGAKCVYLDGFKNRDNEDLPLIVQKADGGFNYASTDMAAIRHRSQQDRAERIIYVTDLGQALHFSMIFSAAKLAGFYDPNKTTPTHVGFGLVLGEDGKKFKTRSGETVPLKLLLEQAIDKAKTILTEREVDWSQKEIDHAARVLGIGAVKYADLSSNRTSDYKFSFDKMLRFDGNTAAFVLYAYVRIQSIQRKTGNQPTNANIDLSEPSELALGLQLRQFNEVLEQFSQDLFPNHLTDYLFQTAQKFNAFFRDCRVEGDPNEQSRLALCQLTAKVLKKGLALLGIETLDRM